MTDEGGNLHDVLSVGVDLDEVMDAFESAGVQTVRDAIGEEDCPDVENCELTSLFDDVGCGKGGFANPVPDSEGDALRDAYQS